MQNQKCFENYPYRFVFIANLLQVTVYATGSFIIYYFGFMWLVLYLLYVFALELRLLKRSCVNCYYYGRVCFSGKGKLCSIIFKKGNPERFIKDKITYIDILPDFLVSIIPIIAGIILLIINFKWVLLSLIVVLFLLSFIGNGLVRGSLACKYCQQRRIGCPAEQLFNKPKKEN